MKPVNRVLLAFTAWEDQKREMQPLLKHGAGDERTMQRLQLVHLQQAKHRLRDTARPDEKPFMALLDNQVNRLEKQLYPNLLFRVAMRLKDRFIDGPAYLHQEVQQRSANMEYLKQQLRERGLGSVAGKLEHHLNPDRRQVCLPLHCQLGADKRLNLDLHFEKDVYGNFQLHQLAGTLLRKDQDMQYYRFELSDWPGLQATHALSLLEGRAMKQTYTDATGHENERWVELGPQGAQHYAPEHPFDVSTAVSAFPNLTHNSGELIRYLESGMQVATRWKQEGQFQSIYVQADPANRGLKIFDAKQRRVTAEQLNQKAKQMSMAKKPEQRIKGQQRGQKNGHQVG